MGDPGCGGRLGWDRDGWLHVCPCPLCLSVPRGGGGRGQGDRRSHPCVGSGEIPTPSTLATLCHKGQGHPLPGCTGDIRGDTGVPKHPIACVPGVPPTPSCSPRDAGGGGLCFHPGLCPPALALPQLLEIFSHRKSYGTQNFPPGEAGAHPPGQRSAPELHIPGRDLGGHRGHLSRPHRGAQPGGPHGGGQRSRQQPERWLVPSWDVPGRCRWKPPLSRNEEGGAGNWLRPPDLPVLQRLRVAVGQQPPLQQNIYPSGTEPWTSLPPARHHAAKLGKTRRSPALGDKFWLWVTNLGSGWQSPALGDKVHLWVTNLGAA